MNWIALIPSLITLVIQIPNIVKAWESSATGGMQAVSDVIKNTDVLGTLADIGGQMFPKLDPTLHAAAAALVIVHPNNTSWAQSALNVVSSTGYIKLDAPLRVDGVWGPRTHAAVAALQTKLGVTVTGFIGDTEYNALAALLAKL